MVIHLPGAGLRLGPWGAIVRHLRQQVGFVTKFLSNCVTSPCQLPTQKAGWRRGAGWRACRQTACFRTDAFSSGLSRELRASAPVPGNPTFLLGVKMGVLVRTPRTGGVLG